MKAPEIEKDFPGPAHYNIAGNAKDKGVASTLHPKIKNLRGKNSCDSFI